jgi:hypothetical protein
MAPIGNIATKEQNPRKIDGKVLISHISQVFYKIYNRKVFHELYNMLGMVSIIGFFFTEVFTWVSNKLIANYVINGGCCIIYIKPRE